MSDDTSTQTATQAAADASGQAPASPSPQSAPQAGTDAASQSPSSSTPSVEELQRIIADLRKEAAANRTKAKELDKLREDAEAAKLSDVEKAQKALANAEARAQAYQQRIARSELKSAAVQAGIIDAQDAIDLLSSRVEYDDDGEPTNVAELVDQLKQQKPHWFTSATQSATPAASAPVPPAANSGGATNPSRSRQAAAASAPASVAGQRTANPMRYSLTDPALWKRS